MAGRKVLLVLLATVCLMAGVSPSDLSQATGSVSEKELSCGEGERLLGDSCFWLQDFGRLPWHAANELCKSKNMTMASLHSQEENDLFWDWTDDYPLWLGMSDLDADGQFKWTDGTPLDFENWSIGQPSDEPYSDCVYMSYGYGEWGNIPCDIAWKTACRHPAS